jgi:hypothetical protein
MIPSAEEAARRLRAAAAQSRLESAARLDAKVPMTPAAVAGRLREASDLLALCRRLHER